MGKKKKNEEVINTSVEQPVINNSVDTESIKGYSSFTINTFLLGEVIVNYRGNKIISVFKDGVNVMNNICHYDYIDILSKIRGN